MRPVTGGLDVPALGILATGVAVGPASNCGAAADGPYL